MFQNKSIKPKATQAVANTDLRKKKHAQKLEIKKQNILMALIPKSDKVC